MIYHAIQYTGPSLIVPLVLKSSTEGIPVLLINSDVLLRFSVIHSLYTPPSGAGGEVNFRYYKKYNGDQLFLLSSVTKI